MRFLWPFRFLPERRCKNRYNFFWVEEKETNLTQICQKYRFHLENIGNFAARNKKGNYGTNTKNYSIRDIMSRSKKKTPASTCCCCKSQKRGKQFCNRKFRRRERMMIGKGQYDRLPNKPIEVTDPWDLGGDGKTFWGFNPDEDWFIRLMRK